jgi:pilus assembly protein CpaC
MRNLFSKYFFGAVLCFIFLTVPETPLSALETSGDVIDLVVGDIETVTANNLTRVSITNPEIADISDAQNGKVSLLAKRAGSTVLFLWDMAGKRSIKVRVVNEDLKMVRARVQKILDEANIEGVSLQINDDEGKVVIAGAVSKDNKARIDKILAKYGDSLLNFTTEEKDESLVQVDMQIVEISTSLEQNLGILWGYSSSSSSSSSSANSGSVNLNYSENLPSGDKFKDLFKIGSFQRTTAIEATFNALIQEGKAKLVSKPRLVVISGKQASFLVGGEIPVENTTTNSTGSSQTTSTTYSQYGVNLQVTPTIREGKIDVVLNVDIRDIDSANSSNGSVAFITRSAQTDLLMDNKQTVVLAGLIKYATSETVTGIPYLSKIPLVGALFRNRQNTSPDTNKEMVIILTPMVLADKKFADKELVMPTPSERQSWQEVDSKYEHESLNPPKMAAPVVTPDIPVTVAPPARMPSEINSYARMVQERISRKITYPWQAMQHVWTGTVKLQLKILSNGTLASEDVIQSSGHIDFDEDAIHAAKMAAPYDVFSAGMNQKELLFTIPIVYNKVSQTGKT